MSVDVGENTTVAVTAVVLYVRSLECRRLCLRFSLHLAAAAASFSAFACMIKQKARDWRGLFPVSPSGLVGVAVEIMIVPLAHGASFAVRARPRGADARRGQQSALETSCPTLVYHTTHSRKVRLMY